ncbi:MAG TPA: hypothetical protein VGE07_22230, partial [Herpetosiphonaceae bacterium]
MTYSRSIQRLALALSLGAALAGCAAQGAPAADRPSAGDATARPTVTAQPAAERPVGAEPPGEPPVSRPVDAQPPAAAPILGFEPAAGGPNTPVTIWGSGYQPGAPVVVRLGFPQPTGEALASAVPDADGRWRASLVIPERFPSGELITDGGMHLVVMNDQNQPLASAPFGFVAGQVPDHVPTDAEARDTLQLLLETASAGRDIRPYLSADRLAQVAEGRPISDFSGISPQFPLDGFAVGEREDRPADALFIPATLRYETFSEERIFRLVIEGDAWKITNSFTREELPELIVEWPGAEWEPFGSGDFNGDGQQESIYVTQSPVALPAGFGDPGSDGAAKLGESVMVVQGTGANALTLLRVDPRGITAGETPLVSFEPHGTLEG